MVNPVFFPWQAGMSLISGQGAAIQKNFMQAWQGLLRDARRGALKPPADRRFSSEAWAASPQALFTAHAYLITANTLKEMAQAARLDDAARERLQFAVMQWVEAASPSNFLATNPDAQKKLIETRGESLQLGLANLMHDLQRGRITQTDEDAFQPGENLAITPGGVVYENPFMQVIQYSPQAEKTYRIPLLMVPPCINKYYILDLQPANSVVLHALQAGFDIFMVSWRNPRPDDPDRTDTKTWDDYLEHGVLQAMKVVSRITRQPQINVLGFCVGGTMLASALAVAKARGADPAQSLTLLTTLLDFGDAGILDVFVDELHARARERQLGQGGLMTAAELSTTFSFLRPSELVWNYVESNYLKGESPRAFDLLAWNADGTNLPGPFFAWYFRNMYLENRLVSGQLESCGVPMDLRALDLPTYVYASRDDHIVPWASAYASTQLLSGPLRFVLGESGHIAGVVNPPERGRRGYWSSGSDHLPPDPQAWLEGSAHARGSWWPDWLQWLEGHSGSLRAARKTLGNKRFPVIEPAPGRYVKVKAV